MQKGQFMINNNTIRWNASKSEMNVQKTSEIIHCRKWNHNLYVHILKQK
jgi:hypothetical protein